MTLTVIGGKWDQLVARLRHHYGYEKDDAERQVDEFLKQAVAPELGSERRPAPAARADAAPAMSLDWTENRDPYRADRESQFARKTRCC